MSSKRDGRGVSRGGGRGPRGRGPGGGGRGRGGKATASNAPKTIREMLLWLYWLGKGTNNATQAGSVVVYYKTKLENYINVTLKNELNGKHPRAPGGIHTVIESAKSLVETVCTEAGKILVTIQQGVQYSDGTHQSELERLKEEAKRFPYPTVEKDLYDCFVYYVTACYWQLQFLYKACGVDKTQGGWKACQYGQTAPDSSDDCKTGGKQNHQQRCSQCSKDCGCLMTFLTATQWQDGKTSKTNIYNGAEYDGQCPEEYKIRPPGSQGPSKCYIQPMGFDKENNLPAALKNGNNLHTHLDPYFKDHTKPFPKLLGNLKLLELLQVSTSSGSSSTLTAPKSWIAGDFWAFWYQLNGNRNLKNTLNNQIKKAYGNGFKKNSSSKDSSAADYTDIEKVFSQLLFAAHGSDNNHHSLLSLSECDGDNAQKDNSSNKCGKYLYGLLSDPFHHVLAWFTNNISLLTFEVLKTLARELKTKLGNFKKGLEGKAKSHACAKEKSCQGIVYCDDTHTVIYRFGFTFYSPASLNGSRKRKCSDLKDQFEEVTAGNSALDVFMKLVKYDPPPAPKPAAAKPVAAKPEAPKAPNSAVVSESQPKGRSETTQDTLSSAAPPAPAPKARPAAAAKPVAAKPEAPKPQGTKPAATKPATTQGSGAGGGSPGVGPGTQASVNASPPAGPLPPPPSGPQASDKSAQGAVSTDNGQSGGAGPAGQQPPGTTGPGPGSPVPGTGSSVSGGPASPGPGTPGAAAAPAVTQPPPSSTTTVQPTKVQVRGNSISLQIDPSKLKDGAIITLNDSQANTFDRFLRSNSVQSRPRAAPITSGPITTPQGAVQSQQQGSDSLQGLPHDQYSNTQHGFHGARGVPSLSPEEILRLVTTSTNDASSRPQALALAECQNDIASLQSPPYSVYYAVDPQSTTTFTIPQYLRNYAVSHQSGITRQERITLDHCITKDPCVIRSPLTVKQCVEFTLRFVECCATTGGALRGALKSLLRSGVQSDDSASEMDDGTLCSGLLKGLRYFLGIKECKDEVLRGEIKSAIEEMKKDINKVIQCINNCFSNLFSKSDNDILDSRLALFSEVKFVRRRDSGAMKTAQPNGGPSQDVTACALANKILECATESMAELQRNNVIPYTLHTALGIEKFLQQHRTGLNASGTSTLSFKLDELLTLLKAFDLFYRDTMPVSAIIQVLQGRRKVTSQLKSNDATAPSVDPSTTDPSRPIVPLLRAIEILSECHRIVERTKKKSAHCLWPKPPQQNNNTSCTLRDIVHVCSKLREFTECVSEIDIKNIGGTISSVVCHVVKELNEAKQESDKRITGKMSQKPNDSGNNDDSFGDPCREIRTSAIQALKRQLDAEVTTAIEDIDKASKEFKKHKNILQLQSKQSEAMAKLNEAQQQQLQVYKEQVQALNTIMPLLSGRDVTQANCNIFTTFLTELVKLYSCGIMSFFAELMRHMAGTFLGLYALHYLNQELNKTSTSRPATDTITTETTETIMQYYKALLDHGFLELGQSKDQSTGNCSTMHQDILSLHTLVHRKSSMENIHKEIVSPTATVPCVPFGQLQFQGGIIKETQLSELRTAVRALMDLNDTNTTSGVSSPVKGSLTEFPYDFQLRHLLWLYSDQRSIERMESAYHCLKRVSQCLESDDALLHRLEALSTDGSNSSRDPYLRSLFTELESLFSEGFVLLFAQVLHNTIMPNCFSYRVFKLHELRDVVDKIVKSAGTAVSHDTATGGTLASGLPTTSVTTQVDHLFKEQQLTRVSHIIDALDSLDKDIEHLKSLIDFLRSRYVFDYAPWCVVQFDTNVLSKVFISSVPVVYSVLKLLHSKCNNNWMNHKLNENNTANPVNSSLGNFMLTCGYDPKHLNSKQGKDIKSPLDGGFRQLMKLNANIHNALRNGNGNFLLHSSSGMTTATSSLRLPRNVTDMLLWMFFLPFCSKYNSVLERLKCLLCNDCQDHCACKSGTAVQCNCTTQKACKHPSGKIDAAMLKSVFDHIPVVLLSLGGHDGLKATLFSGIEKMSRGQNIFEYYCYNGASQTQDCTTATTPCCHSYCTARTVMAIIAILDLVFQHLKRQCHKEDQNSSAVWEFQRFTGDFIITERLQSNDCSLYNFVLFMGISGTHLQSNVQQLVGGTLYRRCATLTESLHTVYKKVREWFRSQKDISSKCHVACSSQCCVHCSLCSAPSQTSTTPTTIRQMMLWLIGLPVTKEYGNGNGLMQTVTQKAQGIEGLKDKITSSTGSTSFELQYDSSIVGMMTVISQIEGGLKSVLCYLRDRFRDKEECLKYNDNGTNALRDFCTYVYKVHTQLRFLMVMCSVDPQCGGWRECIYGGDSRRNMDNNGNICTCSCEIKSEKVASCCKCKDGNIAEKGKCDCNNCVNNKNNNSGQYCRCSFYISYKLCSAAALRKFLLSHEKNNFQGNSLPPMGFSALYGGRNYGSYNGSSLLFPLCLLVDPIDMTVSSSLSRPLSLLTQYCVAIGQLHPSSLGDLFAFFLKLGSKWTELKLYGNNNGGTFKNKLKTELNGYQIGTNGTDTSCDELQKKIKAILNSQHNSHTEKDLMSLMCTQNGSTNSCAPYMKSLSQGVYHYYQLGVQYEATKFKLLQYLYDMLKKLLDKMKELKGAFDACECFQSGKSCDGLISCQYAHPILYKFGFVFGDPSKLKSGKKCQDIKTQLDAVLSIDKSSPSALFKAFECVIQVTYSILLKKAKGCVTTKYNTSNGQQPAGDLKSTNQEMNRAFMLYVSNAMYQSYPKLICTFACKVFDSGHDCSNSDCETRFKEKIAEPDKKIPDPTKKSIDPVSSSAVTCITAVIPQYTAPVIDPFHYKTFQETTTAVSGSTSTSYDFQSALDFHVQGASCILPVPANLRSAVDWILRVSRGAPATGASATKGDKKNNDCAVVCQKGKDCNVSHKKALLCDPEVVIFQCLAQEISCILNGDKKDSEKKPCDQKDRDTLSTCNVSSTVSQCQECNALSTCNTSSNTCAQCLLRNLAQGLRTFVGYKDMTQEVKGEVLKERNTVRKEICSLLECLKGFMCNNGVSSSATSSKCSLSAELGNALLKGRYEIKGEPLRDILEAFLEHYDILTGYTENLKGAPFTDVLCIFSRALTSEHKQCDSDLRCNTLRDCNKDCKKLCETTTADTSTKNNCLPQGLSQLCEFFQGIQRFSCEWDHIGKKGSASKGSEAEECKKRGEQLQCCSKYCTQPCSSSCSKVCHFAPSSDVVFNERQKAECLGWTFNGQKKDECDKKDCPQDWPCKGPNKDCSTSLSSSSSSSPSCPRGFFQQLQCGLHVLGQCAQKVSALSQIGNNSVTSGATAGAAQCNTGTNNDSQCHITQYRNNICALIEGLKNFGEHIEGCKFEGEPEGPKECKNVCALNCNAVSQDGALKSETSVKCSPSCCSCRADPSYAVDGAKKLMEETKKGVEKKITGEMKKGIEKAYAAAYGWDNDDLRISNCNAFVKKAIAQKLDLYKSHLDDLKRLCQWLYRMGQLYASGLKGFVESLVSHLEHIVQVIDWITGIERMIRRFGMECVSTAAGLLTVDVLQCVPACCQRHQRDVPSEASVNTALCDQKMCDQKAPCTNGTVTDAAPSSTGSNDCVTSPSVFFHALNCRIENLLSSYVLGPLPKGAQKECDKNSQGASPSASSSVERSDTFRQFLQRLRLLALDRYTLQLWEDNKDCIRHWSIFKDGIVRHSNLEGIKRALCCLTQMEDYRDIKELKECGLVPLLSDCSSSSKDGQKDSSVQCSNAPPSGPISSTLSASRIHDFHAICVLQKFSYEAPLRALQCSIKGLERIIKALQNCDQGLQHIQALLKKCDCHSRGVTFCEDQCQQSCNKECCKDILSVCSQERATATPFCELYRTLCDFLCEPYGVCSLAQFLHTILGPNAFSAVIFSLRDLRDVLCQFVQCSEDVCSEPEKALQCTSAPVPSSKDSCSESNGALQCSKDVCCLCRLMRRMCAIVSALTGRNHLRTLKDTVSCVQRHVMDDCYSLASVTKRLQAFVDVLKREYIFSYPVVCGTQSDKECDTQCDRTCSVQCCGKSKDASLVCSSQSSVTPSLTSATSTLSLTSPMPLLCAHCHMTSSICPECIPLLSRTFITLVPVLYPQLCYLAYQCRLYWQQDDMNGYKDSALRSLMRTFGFESKDLYDYLYIDVPFSGTHIDRVLCKETNSLQLLCDNISEPYQHSPFNKDCPLYRLYTMCISYYQRRKNERLTDSKSATPVTPTSLREILRFFVYLPFSTQFHDLQCTMQRYCSQSCVVHFSDLFATLMMSSAMSAVLLQLIECPQGAFLRFFDEIYTNTEGLYLGTNTETLLYQLCDLSVTLYRGLKFLSLQCYAEPSLAGWKDCRLRGAKKNKDSDDITQALDAQQLQFCAYHLCLCQSIGAKGSSTTGSVLTTAAPMGLNSDSSASTPASQTTSCSFPLLRYLTDADRFFTSTLTVPGALRKVCLNDSCQEMIYRHMAPRGWEKEMLQCAHRDEQNRDSDLKACSSVCHLKDSDPNGSDYSNCRVSCCHPCCRAQCSTLYGHDLFHLLRNFVGHEHDADPLLQFTRYMVAIAAWPPDSLSGYMTFMLRFSDWLRKEKNTVSGSISNGNTSQKNDSNGSVLSSLKSEISLFPGEFDHNCLIAAFLEVTHCEHNTSVAHTVSATPVASPSTDASCLSSSSCDGSLSSLAPTSSVTISVLSDCKDCNCIIYPLDYEVYDLYLAMYARRYLTWMLHFGPRLHRGMRALEKEFKRHIGDKNGTQSAVCATDPGASGAAASSRGTANASVLQCPYAFAELHSSGLHFWDRNRMCRNNISCQCLVDALQCSLHDSSPLAKFLRQCDSFLWSVRKPFYWLTMALWIVATVYLLFVHLWRLDSWRLLSHVIRSRASHLVYPKVLLSAELDHSYERYYAPR